jgi:hypothetical protein
MATQGTTKVLGGTTYKRYPDPASPGTANSLGLYPWSVFKAPICAWNGVDSPTLVPDLSNYDGVHLLLFISDIPALLELRATDTAAKLQFSAPGTANTLSVPFLFTTLGGTTPSTISTQGKVISGYTGAFAEVYCTGFPASGEVSAPGAEGVASYTEVICIANGPVISSPVSSLYIEYKQSSADGFSPVPIIIGFLEYTAAIRDAGNLITLSDGSLYQVVGLWNQP